MRIISGEAKGTKLYTLEGLETRPTLDRVKESIFNIIRDSIQDSEVLDLFAGSGAIGLEFASRGAKKIILCDKSKDAYEIIKKNVEKTHMDSKTTIINKDFKKVIADLEGQKFDVIYLDPPYKTDFIKESLEELLKRKCIKNETLIIAETDAEEKVKNQIKEINFDVIDERKYGRAYILFLKKGSVE